MFCHSRKILVIAIGGLMSMGFSVSMMFKNPDCPTGYTGAPSATNGQVKYCTNCHNDFALNSPGGSVLATGLPSGTYIPGQTYDFSIKISHSAADKSVWGFAVKAVNMTDNQVVGTLSTTNANASIKGTVGTQTLELSHDVAPVTNAQSNYTFVNLKWTAPASPLAKENQIRFYITGMPCDGDDGTGSDYVYTSTVDASLGALPLHLVSFKAQAVRDNQVGLYWQTAQELNTALFELEASANNADWTQIASITAKGNIASSQSYSYTDHNPMALGGNNYYRLKMIDKDGAYKYSPVQVVLLKHAGIVIQNLTPQPMQANTRAIIFKVQNDKRKHISISLSDMNGRLLFTTSQLVEGGVQMIELPFSKIPVSKGLVNVSFRAEGFEKTFRLWVD